MAAALLVAGGPQAALGQEPATMTGETLIATPASVATTAQCDLDHVSTFSFSASGVAVGAYAGTFTESGTVTVGPQSMPFPTGPLLSLDSSFTIEAGDTTVTGAKHLVAPGGTGSCITPEQHAGAAPQYYVELVGATLEYSASISGPAGRWTEAGTASALGHENRTATGLPVSSGFGERFETATRSSQPAAVSLSPPAAVNPVGTSHTVTAAVATASGEAAPGVVVRFAVTGSVATTGWCTTDVQGRCSLTYRGPDLPGGDVITAYADTNGDGVPDPTEPSGQAAKSWVVPLSTPGHVTGGGQIASLGRPITFGLEARSTASGLQGGCTVVDQATGTKIRCETVTALVQTPTHASVFGSGTLDGAAMTYRIDVDDLGEPGAGVDTFQIQTDGGYLAGGVLSAGNVQIHAG
jgi:hypothetical protein